MTLLSRRLITLAEYVPAVSCGWDEQDIMCLTNVPGTENSGFWPSRDNIVCQRNTPLSTLTSNNSKSQVAHLKGLFEDSRPGDQRALLSKHSPLPEDLLTNRHVFSIVASNARLSKGDPGEYIDRDLLFSGLTSSRRSCGDRHS